MQIDKHILIRYFLGQSSEDEKETIRKWLESDDANKNTFVRERIRFDASIVANKEEITTNKPFRMNSILRKSLQIVATILLLRESGIGWKKFTSFVSRRRGFVPGATLVLAFPGLFGGKCQRYGADRPSFSYASGFRSPSGRLETD